MPFIPYIIQTFRAGFSDESDKGPPGSFKNGYNLDIHTRDDVLKCGSTVTSISTTLNDLVQFFVTSNDGSVYAFGSAGSVYAVAGDPSDPALNFVYNDEAGNILGAAEFQASDGVTYMYWATATQVARRDMSTGEKAVPWTNVVANYKTDKISSSAAWHPMGVISGQLMMGNAEGLATLDYSQNWDPYKLNIRPGNYVNALLERDDYAILGSQRWDGSEEGHIWSWITSAINWVQKKRIPIKGVNALIQTEFNLLQGGPGGELFFSDFVNNVPIAKVPGGGQVNPGGVAIDDDLALFGFYGGSNPGLWSYGRRMKDRPTALNYQYRLAQTTAGSTISTVGAVTVFNGVPIASWGTTDGSTTNYGVDTVSSTTLANAIYEGLEFTGGQPHLNKLVDTVALLMTPLPSGTSVSVRVKFDKATTGGDSSAGAGWQYAVTGGGVTTFSTAGQSVAVFNVGKPGRIFEVGLEINASGSSTPEIHAITTYLQPDKYEYA